MLLRLRDLNLRVGEQFGLKPETLHTSWPLLIVEEGLRQDG